MSTNQKAVSKFNNINGVTCYMGSILHILQQTPIFSGYIYTGYHIYDYMNFKKIENNEEITKLISYQLNQIFKASVNNEDGKITPTSFRSTISKKNPMWGEHRYQDSQEFFNFLITSLEEEMGRHIKFIPGKNYISSEKNHTVNYCIKNIIAQKKWEQFIKKEWSPLKHMFTGLLCHQRKCSKCYSESQNYQTFISIQIQIPLDETNNIYKEFTLEECLDDFSKNQILDENEKMKCNFCKQLNRASEEPTIYKPPELLVIHIKRFKMDNYGTIYQKIKNKVNYPINNLNISKYLSNWSPYKNKCIYNLFGINIHIGFGNTIDSGHYISIIKNRETKNWHGYDDSNPVTNITNMNQLVNKDACLLFYKLKND